MVTISAQQMRALNAAARTRFEERMVEHMRVRSQLGLPEPQLRERTLRLTAVAEHHGIEAEPHIRRFLEITFDRLPDSLRHPEVLSVLRSTGIGSSAKVAFIADILSSKGP